MAVTYGVCLESICRRIAENSFVQTSSINKMPAEAAQAERRTSEASISEVPGR
jgi:hypothetical protein